MNAVTATHSVGEIVLQIFEHNDYVSRQDSERIRSEAESSTDASCYVLERLKEVDKEKFDEVMLFCIQKGFFSESDFRDVGSDSGEMAVPGPSGTQECSDAAAQAAEEVVSEVPEAPETKDAATPPETRTRPARKTRAQESADDSDGHEDTYAAARTRTAPFTSEEVHELISKGVNLYKAVPGHLVPKSDNREYAKFQLFRFIDANASDFLFHTHKKGGKVWYQLQFKINGECETQDSSQPCDYRDTDEKTENYFFSTVRKYVGTTAGINADSKHTAQDGRFSLDYKGMRDFRLNSMPVQCYDEYFPKYVIRLTSQADNVRFDDLYMLPFVSAQYGKIIHGRVAGLTIITGPTGAGKSTTWYAMVNEIDKEKNNILSIEKPIESAVFGIHQTGEDVKERKDKAESYTIRDGIRGALRQALDLLIVGEMRDKQETRDTTDAGLVGNKVFTTYHTNSAVDTILRMQEEEVSRNKIANGVKFVTAQRLVKKLCPHCSVRDPEAEKIMEKAAKAFRVSQRQLQNRIIDVLEDIPEQRFSLEDVEIALERWLKTISASDAESIVDELGKRKAEFDAAASKEDKIRVVLDIAAPYPNKDAREFFASAAASADVRTANPSGCDHKDCRKGYVGRVGIYEVLEFDKSVRRFINDPTKPLVEMEDFLTDKGFVSMRMYGYVLILLGLVSHEDFDSAIE